MRYSGAPNLEASRATLTTRRGDMVPLSTRFTSLPFAYLLRPFMAPIRLIASSLVRGFAFLEGLGMRTGETARTTFIVGVVIRVVMAFIKLVATFLLRAFFSARFFAAMRFFAAWGYNLARGTLFMLFFAFALMEPQSCWTVFLSVLMPYFLATFTTSSFL